MRNRWCVLCNFQFELFNDDSQVNVECMNARENRVGIDQVKYWHFNSIVISVSFPCKYPPNFILHCIVSLSPHIHQESHRFCLEWKRWECRRFHWLLLWWRKMKCQTNYHRIQIWYGAIFIMSMQVKDRVDKNLVKENDNIRKYMQQIKVAWSSNDTEIRS